MIIAGIIRQGGADMFSKITTTIFRPEKPILVWDGNCPFCYYWVVQLMKITGGKVMYIPYQEIHSTIPDIPESAFEEAVRLIDTQGHVYNGPETAYWCLRWTHNGKGLLKKYHNSEFFRYLSDAFYSFASRRRGLMLKATFLLLGKDPHKTKPYWLIYLFGIAGLILFLILS